MRLSLYLNTCTWQPYYQVTWWYVLVRTDRVIPVKILKQHLKLKIQDTTLSLTKLAVKAKSICNNYLYHIWVIYWVKFTKLVSCSVRQTRNTVDSERILNHVRSATFSSRLCTAVHRGSHITLVVVIPNVCILSLINPNTRHLCDFLSVIIILHE